MENTTDGGLCTADAFDIFFGPGQSQVESLVDFISHMWRHFLHNMLSLVTSTHSLLLMKSACSFFVLNLSCCDILFEHSKQE